MRQPPPFLFRRLPILRGRSLFPALLPQAATKSRFQRPDIVLRKRTVLEGGIRIQARDTSLLAKGKPHLQVSLLMSLAVLRSPHTRWERRRRLETLRFQFEETKQSAPTLKKTQCTSIRRIVRPERRGSAHSLHSSGTTTRLPLMIRLPATILPASASRNPSRFSQEKPKQSTFLLQRMLRTRFW